MAAKKSKAQKAPKKAPKKAPAKAAAAPAAPKAAKPAGASKGAASVKPARAVAAIPYVRAQVLRLHGRPHERWHSDLAQAAGVVAVTVGWALDAVPMASIGAIALVAAVNLAGIRAAPRPAKVLGMQQAVLGLTVVAVTAIAATPG